jgi:hypothetical protein
MPYMYFMTDQRPAVSPDSVGIFVSSAEKT